MYGKFGMPRARCGRLRRGDGDCRMADVRRDVLYMRRHRAYRPFDLFARIDRPNRRMLRELLRVGAPIAGSMLAEGGLFVVRGADDGCHGRDASTAGTRSR